MMKQYDHVVLARDRMVGQYFDHTGDTGFGPTTVYADPTFTAPEAGLYFVALQLSVQDIESAADTAYGGVVLNGLQDFATVGLGFAVTARRLIAMPLMVSAVVKLTVNTTLQAFARVDGDRSWAVLRGSSFSVFALPELEGIYTTLRASESIAANTVTTAARWEMPELGGYGPSPQQRNYTTQSAGVFLVTYTQQFDATANLGGIRLAVDNEELLPQATHSAYFSFHF